MFLKILAIKKNDTPPSYHGYSEKKTVVYFGL